MSKKIALSLLIIILSLFSLFAQHEYAPPLNIPPALSANFGELRGNHFHSGLDYKTQQVISKPVFSVEDGYVSRISVSPGGYGLALYIDHPATGHTTVYGHLNSFSKKISDYVVAKQYELESFRVDLQLEPDQIPVAKGEQVALSGNTGSSGGPHLHFEFRDTETQDPVDPLLFYANKITDTQKPDLRGIAFYPIAGKGVVNGDVDPLRLNVAKNNQGVPLALNVPVKAWGRIGVGVKAYDRMNGQSNIYGVKHVRLFVDENRVFSSSIGRFSFDKSRMLNTLIDFEDWRERNSFYMKSFVEPGNKLDFYDVVNSGFVDIDQERDYRMRYELEDHHGNVLTYSFVVKGERQNLEPVDYCGSFMPWSLHNSFVNQDFVLNIPSGNLYSSICYKHDRVKSNHYFSDIYQVHDRPVPLHKSAKMWMKIHTDTLQNRKQYGIVEITKTGNTSWLGGEYKNGGLEANIGELGRKYAVSADSVPPTIVPVNPASWVSTRKIQFRLSDDKSGVSSFRGTINGKYVLFTHDMKSPVYTYLFDDRRLEKGQKQELVFTVTDGVGNRSEYRYAFDY